MATNPNEILARIMQGEQRLTPQEAEEKKRNERFDSILSNIMGGSSVQRTPDEILAEIMGVEVGPKPTETETDRQFSLREFLAEGFRDSLDNIFPTMAGQFRGPQDYARRSLLGHNALESAVYKPVTAMLQIPGLFTDQRILTDRMAEYIVRKSEGTQTELEAMAKVAGLTDKEIAVSSGLGDFLGMALPIAGSVGVVKFLLKDATQIWRWPTAGNLVVDTIAGLIYGGALTPEENLKSRWEHAKKEAAVFGVGRIVMTGLGFSAMAMRARRVNLKKNMAILDDILERTRKGERVVLNKEEGIALAELLTDETFIANSTRAQELMRVYADETSLVQGIMESNWAGVPSGVVKDMSGTFEEVSAMVEKFRKNFPHLKFESIRRNNYKEVVRDASGKTREILKGQYDIYFGVKGLNNAQRQHYKKFGRFPGQIIEKHGTQFEYVRPGKEGWIWVRVPGMKGKKGLKRLKDVDITDSFGIIEEIEASTMMKSLYNKFITDMQGVMKEADDIAADLIPEYELIRMIRAGELKISPEARRMFDLPGVVTHPEELGMTAEQLSGYTHEQLLNRILNMGYDGGAVAPARRVISFDEIVELWAKKEGILVKGQPVPDDFHTMKAYFGQQARNEFWSHVPEEDFKIYSAIRDEFLKLAESREFPVSVLANNKGFTLIPMEEGRVALRDINSGLVLEFGSEAYAREALKKFVRTERNMLGGGIFPEDSGGIGAFTGGFDPTDGVFSFEGSGVDALAFVDHLPGLQSIRNRRDVLIDLQERTGVRFFSEVLDPIYKALAAMRREQEPWAYKIRDTWKHLSRNEKNQAVDFWRSIEGQELTASQVRLKAREIGLSEKQVNAVVSSHEMFDAWHAMSGMKKEQYIQWYYSQIQPAAMLKQGHVNYDDFWKKVKVPPGFEWWAAKTRHGELNVVEMDPEVVMQKYIRGLLFEKHVQPYYEAARNLTRPKFTPKFKDLPPDVAARFQAQSSVAFRPNDPILDQVVRDYLGEWLTIIRGAPLKTKGTAREALSRFMGKLGINIHADVLEEYVNIGVSNMYGAAMGLRMALLTRNGVQNVWNMYTRIGAKHASRAMEQAMSLSGYDEALAAGAIRATTGGIPTGDALWGAFLERYPITASNTLAIPFASALRLGLRMGRVSNKLARKMLIPYSGVDDSNRVWSYFWQKYHTEEWLAKFEAEEISWDKFVEEGLPFFHRVIKRDFARLYNKGSREEALRFIGRQAADETNYIYGMAAQPAKMQSPAGRAFGMFGTWPLWSLENYSRRSFRGTMSQQAKFWLRNVALVGAFSNLTMQSGIALWNWIAPFSFFSWAGGPAAQWVADFVTIMGGPGSSRPKRLMRLGNDMRRLVLPGQILVTGDIRHALNAEDPVQGGLRLLLGRPVDDPAWPMEWMVPENYEPFPIMPPSTDTALPKEPRNYALERTLGRPPF